MKQKQYTKITQKKQKRIESYLLMYPTDINIRKTDLLIQLMLMAAIYEFMYMHKTPVSVVIGEYLKVSDFFLEKNKKNFLNAILDKISKVSRVTEI